MVGFTAARIDQSNQRMSDYMEKVNHLSTEELIAEFFTYLDYTEESDSGRVFNPVQISSCRVLMSEPLNYVLQTLRKKADGYYGISTST
jgi:hypothetical protein